MLVERWPRGVQPLLIDPSLCLSIHLSLSLWTSESEMKSNLAKMNRLCENFSPLWVNISWSCHSYRSSAPWPCTPQTKSWVHNRLMSRRPVFHTFRARITSVTLKDVEEKRNIRWSLISSESAFSSIFGSRMRSMKASRFSIYFVAI